MKPSISSDFYFLGPGTYTIRGDFSLGKKKSVDGIARKIILSIKPSLEDKLVIMRFTKVCTLLRDAGLARQAFADHGKEPVLNRALQSQSTHA